MIRVVNVGNEPKTPQIEISVVRKMITDTIIAAASANFHATSLFVFCFFISFSLLIF